MKKSIVSLVLGVAAIFGGGDCHGLVVSEILRTYMTHHDPVLEAESTIPSKVFIVAMDKVVAGLNGSKVGLLIKAGETFAGAKSKSTEGICFWMALAGLWWGYEGKVYGDDGIPALKSDRIGLYETLYDLAKFIKADDFSFHPGEDQEGDSINKKQGDFADAYEVGSGDKGNRVKATLLDKLGTGNLSKTEALYHLMFLVEMVETGKANNTDLTDDNHMPYDKKAYDKVFDLMRMIVE
jgi:hypothetical protein